MCYVRAFVYVMDFIADGCCYCHTAVLRYVRGAEVTCAWNAYLNSNDECVSVSVCVYIVTPPGLLGG